MGWEYENIKVSSVNYGFGWSEANNPSTETINNILTRVDSDFKKLKDDNKELKTTVLELAKLADEFFLNSAYLPEVIEDKYRDIIVKHKDRIHNIKKELGITDADK